MPDPQRPAHRHIGVAPHEQREGTLQRGGLHPHLLERHRFAGERGAPAVEQRGNGSDVIVRDPPPGGKVDPERIELFLQPAGPNDHPGSAPGDGIEGADELRGEKGVPVGKDQGADPEPHPFRAPGGERKSHEGVVEG